MEHLNPPEPCDTFPPGAPVAVVLAEGAELLLDYRAPAAGCRPGRGRACRGQISLAFAAATKTAKAGRSKTSAGPCGFLLSRTGTATPSPTSTQAPPLVLL